MTPIICTVDIVLLTLRSNKLHVALLKREQEPFAGMFALPGGYVHSEQDRDVQDAAARVLLEKTGFVSPYLEQLATFSGPARDPRGWSVSVVYYALVPEEIILNQTSIKLLPVEGLKGLPFDHQHVVETAVARLRSKSTYSSLPVYLCEPLFTLPHLQEVYEAVLGEPINKVSFRRKMKVLAMVEAVDGVMEAGKANRPAKLYRLKKEFKNSLSLLNRAFNAG